MKNIFLILLTGSLLAACTPKSETTTTTDTTTTEAVVPDTTLVDPVDPVVTDPVTDTTDDAVIGDTTTDATDATNNPADPGVDSTLTNDDDAGAGEEVDMAVGDGLEGTVADFDATTQAFTLNENDANYAVVTSPTTVYEGLALTSDDFFSVDRNAANVAVEGDIDEATNTLNATKVTLN